MIQKENIPQNEFSQRISEILKRTNKLVKEGKLDSAQGELIRANLEAKERYYKSSSSPHINITQRSTTDLPLKPIEALMNTIISPVSNNIKTVEQPSIAPTKSVRSNKVNNRTIEFDYYREALKKMWYDGPLTPDEKRQLQKLRMVLEITDTEHGMLEKETKMECYKDALRQFLINGTSPVRGAKTIVQIREAFDIRKEEHEAIKKQMFTKESESRNKILIIDDDVKFLEAIAALLTEDGFNVTATNTSDEAYTILNKYIPDLILCDINLKNSSMDGLSFYKKIRVDKRFNQIPFIFITGYADEEIVRAGRELGADDYVIKPVPRNVLTALIRGKIKRFRQLLQK